ncbi:MAG: MarR family transcriptional regulator [Candidatus Omnitrophica bacterium]|nr:MarR family transcriptional regulator [Candidatus Omnitrophota bacterium]
MPKVTLEEFAAWWTEKIAILARALMRHESNVLSRGDITLPQFWALECLKRRGSCQMNELAKGLNMTFPAATGLVNRLVKNGLVRRSRSEEDRRAVHVTITPKGRDIIDEVYKQRRKSVRKLFKPLTDSERSQYMDIVNKLVDGLSRPTPNT